jgi:hypothetical protein
MCFPRNSHSVFSLPFSLISSLIHTQGPTDEAFIKQWGYRRDYLYYITDFGALKRKNSESISGFTKRFNKMYRRIPDEIKPNKSSAKITYANAFDAELSLLLRERIFTTLLSMQEVAIEVESNILASDRLKYRFDKDKKK